MVPLRVLIVGIVGGATKCLDIATVLGNERKVDGVEFCEGRSFSINKLALFIDKGRIIFFFLTVFLILN